MNIIRAKDGWELVPTAIQESHNREEIKKTFVSYLLDTDKSILEADPCLEMKVIFADKTPSERVQTLWKVKDTDRTTPVLLAVTEKNERIVLFSEYFLSLW